MWRDPDSVDRNGIGDGDGDGNGDGDGDGGPKVYKTYGILALYSHIGRNVKWSQQWKYSYPLNISDMSVAWSKAR